MSGNYTVLMALMVADGAVSDAPFHSAAVSAGYFMHRDNFLIYVGGLDGRYQLRETGITRYGQMLSRFLFQPQQYFGYTHFISYPWVRAATFFSCIAFMAAAFVLGIAAYLRRRGA